MNITINIMYLLTRLLYLFCFCLLFFKFKIQIFLFCFYVFVIFLLCTYRIFYLVKSIPIKIFDPGIRESRPKNPDSRKSDKKSGFPVNSLDIRCTERARSLYTRISRFFLKVLPAVETMLDRDVFLNADSESPLMTSS